MFYQSRFICALSYRIGFAEHQPAPLRVSPLSMRGTIHLDHGGDHSADRVVFPDVIQ